MTNAVEQEAPSSPDLELIPAMFEHSVRVYVAMAEKAKIDDEGLLVYDGHLTRLFISLRLSVPYYTQIKNQLIAMGCIEQTRRGGGSGTSRWVLWKAPDLGDWKMARPLRPTRGSKIAQQDQAIRTLAERVDKLETTIAGLIEAMAVKND